MVPLRLLPEPNIINHIITVAEQKVPTIIYPVSVSPAMTSIIIRGDDTTQRKALREDTTTQKTVSEDTTQRKALREDTTTQKAVSEDTTQRNTLLEATTRRNTLLAATDSQILAQEAGGPLVLPARLSLVPRPIL
jgi:hypothetical protein